MYMNRGIYHKGMETDYINLRKNSSNKIEPEEKGMY